MDLIDEQDGAVAPCAAAASASGHHRLDFLDAAEDGAEGNELRSGVIAGDELGQRRLAGAGRSPEDDRGEFIALDLAAQRLLRPENMLLPDEVLEALPGAYAQPGGACRVFRVCLLTRRGGVEQAHGRNALCRRASLQQDAGRHGGG